MTEARIWRCGSSCIGQTKNSIVSLQILEEFRLFMFMLSANYVFPLGYTSSCGRWIITSLWPKTSYRKETLQGLKIVCFALIMNLSSIFSSAVSNELWLDIARYFVFLLTIRLNQALDFGLPTRNPSCLSYKWCGGVFVSIEDFLIMLPGLTSNWFGGESWKLSKITVGSKYLLNDRGPVKLSTATSKRKLHRASLERNITVYYQIQRKQRLSGIQWKYM